MARLVIALVLHVPAGLRKLAQIAKHLLRPGRDVGHVLEEDQRDRIVRIRVEQRLHAAEAEVVHRHVLRRRGLGLGQHLAGTLARGADPCRVGRLLAEQLPDLLQRDRGRVELRAGAVVEVLVSLAGVGVVVVRTTELERCPVLAEALAGLLGTVGHGAGPGEEAGGAEDVFHTRTLPATQTSPALNFMATRISCTYWRSSKCSESPRRGFGLQ